MQRAIEDATDVHPNCPSCGALAENKYIYSNHVVIDTSIFTDDRYTYKKTNIQHTLHSVAKTLTLNGENYILAGVVHYIRYTDDNGHYIAYAFAGTHWFKYDDLQKKRETANPTEKISPHLIIYVKC